jgi:hypothetical protein
LVLRPIVKPARKSRYTLDELLSGMTSTMFRKKSIGGGMVTWLLPMQAI